MWLVWSEEHGMWWRAGHCGYTRSIREAGRYAKAEADEIVRRANIVDFNEIAIPDPTPGSIFGTGRRS